MMVEINNSEGNTHPRRQSRRTVRVRGLPRNLSRDDIRKYFEVTGRINYVFRERVDKDSSGNDQFSGACRITYEEAEAAREAVRGFDGRKFSYRHVMTVRMAVSSHSSSEDQTILPSDWVCQTCSSQEFKIVNFHWQEICFSCGKERGKNVQKTSAHHTKEAYRDEYIEEEEEQETKPNISHHVTPVLEVEEEQIIPPSLEKNIEKGKIEETSDQKCLPSLDREIEREEMEEKNDQICLPSLEEELEDVLLNTFMNHRAFSESVPLLINISVGKAIKAEPSSNRSKLISVNLSVTEELLNKTENNRPQQQDESMQTETLDVDEAAEPEFEQNEAIEVSNDEEVLDFDKENERDVVTEKQTKQRKTVFSSYEDDFMLTAISESDGRVNTKEISDVLNISHADIVKRIQTLESGLDQGKKKFTLAQDKEIIDKVIEVLPGKSLPTLEIPDQVLKVLSQTMSRTESSVSARWKGKLRLWLIQYYNNNKRSWKDFSVKASQKRREDIAKYFNKQAKKSGLSLDLMNVKRKK